MGGYKSNNFTFDGRQSVILLYKGSIESYIAICTILSGAEEGSRQEIETVLFQWGLSDREIEDAFTSLEVEAVSIF